MGVTVFEPLKTAKKPEGDSKKDREIVDVEKMLEEMRVLIEQLHKDKLSAAANLDMSSKKPIDILNVSNLNLAVSN